jgi:hypothetical protein
MYSTFGGVRLEDGRKKEGMGRRGGRGVIYVSDSCETEMPPFLTAQHSLSNSGL